MASCYVTSINDGAIPDVDDAFLATVKLENNRRIKEALKLFLEEMRVVQLPAPSRSLEDIYKTARSKALEYLRENIEHDKIGHYMLNVKNGMDNILGSLKEKNKEQIRALCAETLKEAQDCTPLKESIENKVYHKAPGGHKRFQRDLKETEEKFMSRLPGYEKHEILLPWIEYSESLRKAESEIIEADEQLSALEREEERKHHKDQIAKVIEEHKNKLKEKDKLLEKEREVNEAKMEKVNAKHTAILREKDELLKQETERYVAKMENVNEKHRAVLREKDELLKKETERYVAKMENVHEKHRAVLREKDELLKKERERYVAKMEKVNKTHIAVLREKDELLKKETERYVAKMEKVNEKHIAVLREKDELLKKERERYVDKMEKENEKHKAILREKDELLKKEREHYETDMKELIEDYKVGLETLNILLEEERNKRKEKENIINMMGEKYETVFREHEEFKNAEEKRRKRSLWDRICDAFFNI